MTVNLLIKSSPGVQTMQNSVFILYVLRIYYYIILIQIYVYTCEKYTRINYLLDKSSDGVKYKLFSRYTGIYGEVITISEGQLHFLTVRYNILRSHHIDHQRETRSLQCRLDSDTLI